MTILQDSASRSRVMLFPILVCSNGRSGSSLLMALLGTDTGCRFSRVFPYEIRYLTYLAKFASLWGREDFIASEKQPHCGSFTDGLLGIPPWRLREECFSPTDLPSASGILRALWSEVSETVSDGLPDARWYAEKVPTWVVPFVHEITESYTAFLFRDPRDVFLSANAFMRKGNSYGFFRLPGDSDLDHAINLSFYLLDIYENYRALKHRADVGAIRYEDLALKPEQATARMREVTGLTLQALKNDEHYSQHRTSGNVEQSVGRWQREAVAPAVRTCLETHLREQMIEFGYTLTQSEASENGRYIDFSLAASGTKAVELSPQATLETVDRFGASITVNGDDFFMVPSLEPFSAEEVREVWVCVSTRTGNHWSLSWRDADEPFADERSIHVRYLPSSHYQILRFAVHKNARWRGNIAQAKLGMSRGRRPGAPDTSVQIRWIRFVSHFD